jgi:hypothetical protein
MTYVFVKTISKTCALIFEAFLEKKGIAIYSEAIIDQKMT